jgi:hypothetical protein
MGRDAEDDRERVKRAAGRGRQDFCERENSGFPEIEMADRTQFRGRRMWGGGGGKRVIYVNT